jgi:hypothetical protein
MSKIEYELKAAMALRASDCPTTVSVPANCCPMPDFVKAFQAIRHFMRKVSPPLEGHLSSGITKRNFNGMQAGRYRRMLYLPVGM